MNTVMTYCREAAVSTGLEDEADITAYIDLCLRAWRDPAEYMVRDPAAEATNERPVDHQESVTD